MRRWWRGLGAIAVASLVAFACNHKPDSDPPGPANPIPAGPPNPIPAENAQPGSQAWQITQHAGQGMLEGYADQVSVNHGQSLGIHLRTDGPHAVHWQLFRMGYYQGLGGRQLAEGQVEGQPQPSPVPAAATGLVECHWPLSFTLQTGGDWVSGIYLLKLTRDDGPQSYVPFVVREDERPGAAVAQASVNTWQAYNRWGGESLYSDSLGLAGGKAREVSYDRPYDYADGAGQFFRYEQLFVSWAESRGYPLKYVANTDFDRDPHLLDGARLFLSVGHDEYWSAAQRDALEQAVAHGLSAAFLSGNSAYWQVRLEPERQGSAPGRTVVCYKDRAPTEDPLAGSPQVTTRFRDPAVGRPESQLLGVMYDAWVLYDTPWVVQNAQSWIYAGTGVQEGETIPLIVGYEVDRTWDGLEPPGVEVVARSPVQDHTGRPTWHNASVYPAPGGGFVFASGTIQWSWGLARPGVTDGRVQQVTDNLFQAAGLHAAPNAPAFASRPGPPAAVPGASPGVGTLVGAAFQEGDDAQHLRRPTGLAVDAQGNIFVTDTGNHAVRLIASDDPERALQTIAGTGQPGTGSGPGAQAGLYLPTAVAVGPDQAVYVADTGNHRIVRLARDGAWTVSTFAGSTHGEAGLADGQGEGARFNTPLGLAFVGPDLYVADSHNDALRKVAPDGTVSTLAHGQGYADGSLAAARFWKPVALAAGDHALWVLDTGNHRLRRVDLSSGQVSTEAGGEDGFADGPADQARLAGGLGLAVSGGRVYLADTGNERVRVLEGGALRTLAGSGQSGAADGPGAQASFSLPSGLAARPDGVLLVVDEGDSTVRTVLPDR